MVFYSTPIRVLLENVQNMYGNAVTASQDGRLRTVSAQRWRDEVDVFGVKQLYYEERRNQ